MLSRFTASSSAKTKAIGLIVVGYSTFEGEVFLKSTVKAVYGRLKDPETRKKVALASPRKLV